MKYREYEVLKEGKEVAINGAGFLSLSIFIDCAEKVFDRSAPMEFITVSIKGHSIVLTNRTDEIIPGFK